MATFFAFCFSILTGTTALATDCQEWFRALKIDPIDPTCEGRCGVADTDMGTFSCPESCAMFCNPQKTKDVLKYYPPLVELCDQEITLIKTFPDEALKVRKAQQTALEETHSRFGGNFRDDESDAFRHCFWSGLISTNLGIAKPDPELARKWLDAHESCSNDPSGTKMDNFNNREGISLANTLYSAGRLAEQTLADACKTAIDQKKLKVINPSGGKK